MWPDCSGWCLHGKCGDSIRKLAALRANINNMCVCVCLYGKYVCNSCQVLDLGTQGMRDQGTMWSELSAEQAAKWIYC